MIKQFILGIFIFLTLLATSTTINAEKLDQKHRCFENICEGYTVVNYLGDQIKILLINQNKSILTYSLDNEEFKNILWKDLPSFNDNLQ